MLKKLMTGMALAAFVISPALVSAETDVKPSYANKKSGKVVFKEKPNKPSSDIAIIDTQDGAEIATIEPAAGAEIAEDTSEKSPLAEKMKLPRKH